MRLTLATDTGEVLASWNVCIDHSKYPNAIRGDKYIDMTKELAQVILMIDVVQEAMKADRRGEL